jgi:hypothetical protein
MRKTISLLALLSLLASLAAYAAAPTQTSPAPIPTSTFGVHSTGSAEVGPSATGLPFRPDSSLRSTASFTCPPNKWCSLSHRRCLDTCPAGQGECVLIGC